MVLITQLQSKSMLELKRLLKKTTYLACTWLIQLVLSFQNKLMFSQIETISEGFSLTKQECLQLVFHKYLLYSEVALLEVHTFLP